MGMRRHGGDAGPTRRPTLNMNDTHDPMNDDWIIEAAAAAAAALGPGPKATYLSEVADAVDDATSAIIAYMKDTYTYQTSQVVPRLDAIRNAVVGHADEGDWYAASVWIGRWAGVMRNVYAVDDGTGLRVNVAY